ncbi:hypothetical protein CHLNCDRAFT_144288 [Chlorella variabilis]|uniref:Aminotransferase class I/classII large domain-containing protein n=1 Tax=Chlorella variabilis TaxID=554065 RepID=E1ZCC8_CHLVA|nr:hypothetical protein CHLNCDRAFT_144288 [Chlorella variabilis]EFN56794.1 hypothetical protein CHLNCDRAFT_144288 [Chlorella variabilis]|eukprot:XP_005848896.1 hypothetical protein CHLNCDRAFT_144288 [Chlorella variabilis]
MGDASAEEQKAAQAAPPAGPSATAADASPPTPFDALRLLSRQGALRTEGCLRQLLSKYHGVEGLVAMNGGLPPQASFPLTSLQFGVAGVAEGETEAVELSPEQLAGSQQYNIAPAGFPPLQRWAAAHVAALHAPPGPHRVLLTAGASQGLELVCSLFLDDGDCLLVEEFTYPQARTRSAGQQAASRHRGRRQPGCMLECNLAPRSCRVLPVPMDHDGMLPFQLEQASLSLLSAAANVLEQAAAAGGPQPKLLYTVPTGQNPTGACTPLERKRAIYDICSRHGLLILEDDAYQYLQFPAGPLRPPGLAGLPARSSYLSLDTQGRVIRLDTCAKFLAPGLRLGWAVAAPAVVGKMTDLLNAQTLGPSGLSQGIAYRLLETWGGEGLERHLWRLQAGYAASAAALHAAARRHLEGLAEWREPRAGMFMWLRLLGVEDASDIQEELREARVVVVPGRACHPRASDPSFRCPFVRVSFSHLPPEELEEGMRRLGAVLHSLQQQRQ